MLRKIYVFEYFLLFLIFKNVFSMDTILTSFYERFYENLDLSDNILLIKRLIR